MSLFFIEEHYEILEKIIAAGKAGEIEIRYNSNGIEWRDDLFDSFGSI